MTSPGSHRNDPAGAVVRAYWTDEPGSAYLEHLTETDLSLLGPVVDSPPTEDASAYLRSHPELVDEALGSSAAFDLVLGADVDSELLVHASPFLVFAVAVYRTVDELGRTTFVEERVTPRMRVPVFDARQLREFGVDPARRYFMVEHLASYTTVMSGPVWTQRRGRWRRQRFSELDAPRLAATLDAVPESDRPGIYRRLGDLALFLTGVFPDHSSARAVHPIELERLLRSLPDVAGSRPTLADVEQLAGDRGAEGLLEWLGPRAVPRRRRAHTGCGARAAPRRHGESLRPGAPVPQSPHRPVPVPRPQPMVPRGSVAEDALVAPSYTVVDGGDGHGTSD